MQGSEDDRIALAEALVALSAADLPYSDLYLHRAETVLGGLWSREQYQALRRERDGLPGMAKELRHLAEVADWPHVREVAQRGASRLQHVGASERLLVLGDAVYGPRVLHAEATALALSGMVVQPTSHLGQVRDDCVARLRFALLHDDECGDLYRMRLAYLDQLEIVAGDATAMPRSTDGLQQRIIEAAEKGDFEQADRLTAAIMDTVSRNAPGRVRVPQSFNGRTCTLSRAFSEDTVRRARELGLSAVTLCADAALNGYLSASFAPVVSGCPHVGMPALSSGMRESLDMLIGRSFVTSAGERYLPSFKAETMLVETFPETEPETHTGLLEAIGVRSRCGVSRLTIEDAARSRGSILCTDLGLDPLDYAVIPIPFDAYVRLAPRFDWGRQHLWTHFDGYQLTRELHLRALVGGDARYGGRDDLCSVARDYEIDHLLARFAVVCRDRLSAQAAQAD